MYPAEHAVTHPDRPAFIMAGSGETVTYREFEERSNRFAHLLRANGIEQYSHYSIYMENHPRFMEACGGGERTGAFYTAINSYLTADEVAYIVNNSDSTVLVTSLAKREVAFAALAQCPDCLLYTSPSPRDQRGSRMPSSA